MPPSLLPTSRSSTCVFSAPTQDCPLPRARKHLSSARRQSSSTPWYRESLLRCAISNAKKTISKNKLWRKRKKGPLFKKCLLIQIVLYRVCNLKKIIQEWWLQCFMSPPPPKSGHAFPKYCVFQLVFYFYIFVSQLLAQLLFFFSTDSCTSLCRFLHLLVRSFF